MSQLVLYFLQGETGESEEVPNAFKIPSSPSTRPTFELFIKYFPIPSPQTMHFRFRQEDPNSGYVWKAIKSFLHLNSKPFFPVTVFYP